MKKSLLLASICLFTISISYAQFETGQKVIGGSFSLSSSNSNSTTSVTQSNQNFGLDASLGKFISPTHLVGFGINYNYSYLQQQSTPNIYTNNINQFGVNYFSTYYKLLAKKLYVFLTGSAFGNYAFNSYNTTLGSVETIQKTNGYSVGIGATPGISYQLNKRVLVNAVLNNIFSISYLNTKTTYSNSSQVDKNSSFNLSSSLGNFSLGNIGIGFSILLNKK